MQIKVSYIENTFSITDFENESWAKTEDVLIDKYWSDEKAPVGRHTKAGLLWSNSALYVRFEANQIEPLIVSESPNLQTKTIGLWDGDVCEIFVAPDVRVPERYFEFEIAPTGEWVDLKIYQSPEKREMDFEYDSKMQAAAKIETDKITMAMKISWSAFGKTPQANDVWKGNLFRCVGSGATRGYLAWQPTKTEKPNFHVPEAFGYFLFSE
jgi:alpha-galactosidase